MKLKSILITSLVLLLSPALFYTDVCAEPEFPYVDNSAYARIIEPELIIYLPTIPDEYTMSIPDATYSIISPLAEAYSSMDYYAAPDIQCHVSTISVSSLKLTWNYMENHIYEISCARADGSFEYSQNICIDQKYPNACYITGLRENTQYIVKIKDLTANTEESVLGTTEKVNVIQTYDYISGWTNCFTYESASGLTRDPSKSAISGAISDPVTDTGIMRDEYGDYCVAMGLYYGRCGDRFLVELENGTQFTVKICDSKGLASDGQGKYHIFGRNRDGKSVIEFIHGSYLPDCVYRSGNYGSYDWYGLKFDNIKSISKIEYGDTVIY